MQIQTQWIIWTFVAILSTASQAKVHGDTTHSSLSCRINWQIRDMYCENPRPTDFSIIKYAMWNMANSLYSYFRMNIDLLRVTLNNCRVSYLYTDSFTGLNTVQYLELSHNKITQLQFGALNGLQALTYLNVSHNQLSFIDKGVLRQIPFLQLLDLSNNQLKVLDVEFQPMLMILDVSYNQLSCIRDEFFDGLKTSGVALSKFWFSNNPHNCRCLMQAVKNTKSLRIIYDSSSYDGKTVVCAMV